MSSFKNLTIRQKKEQKPSFLNQLDKRGQQNEIIKHVFSPAIFRLIEQAIALEEFIVTDQMKNQFNSNVITKLIALNKCFSNIAVAKDEKVDVKFSKDEFSNIHIEVLGVRFVDRSSNQLNNQSNLPTTRPISVDNSFKALVVTLLKDIFAITLPDVMNSFITNVLEYHKSIPSTQIMGVDDVIIEINNLKSCIQIFYTDALSIEKFNDPIILMMFNNENNYAAINNDNTFGLLDKKVQAYKSFIFNEGSSKQYSPNELYYLSIFHKNTVLTITKRNRASFAKFRSFTTYVSSVFTPINATNLFDSSINANTSATSYLAAYTSSQNNQQQDNELETETLLEEVDMPL